MCTQNRVKKKDHELHSMHLDCETLYALKWCIVEKVRGNNAPQRNDERQHKRKHTSSETSREREKIGGTEANFNENLTAVRVLSEISMWFCFILPLSPFTQSTWTLVFRCCCCFSYDFSIVRLQKCLFAQLKPEIQMQSQAALHYEFTDFSFPYFTYEVRSSFAFHPVFQCFYLSIPPEKKWVEKALRTAYCYRKVGKHAYFLDVLFVYLFPFLFPCARAHTLSLPLHYMLLI